MPVWKMQMLSARMTRSATQTMLLEHQACEPLPATYDHPHLTHKGL